MISVSVPRACVSTSFGAVKSSMFCSRASAMQMLSIRLRLFAWSELSEGASDDITRPE